MEETKGTKEISWSATPSATDYIVYYGKPLIAISHTSQGLTTTQGNDNTFKPAHPSPESPDVGWPSSSRNLGNRYRLRQVAGHVVADALVVENTLDAADGAHGDVLVPELAGSEVHDILLGDLANSTLDVLGTEAAAGGDDLATNVLGNGGGAVEREEDGSLQLGLGALDLGRGDAIAEAGPLTESEVDQVIERGQVLGDKVDTPETVFQASQ